MAVEHTDKISTTLWIIWVISVTLWVAANVTWFVAFYRCNAAMDRYLNSAPTTERGRP
jgi:hypothetical protein